MALTVLWILGTIVAAFICILGWLGAATDVEQMWFARGVLASPVWPVMLIVGIFIGMISVVQDAQLWGSEDAGTFEPREEYDNDGGWRA